jgi:hypothetical protein
MQLNLLPAKPSCTACDLHSSAKNVGIPSRHLPTSLPPDPTNPVVIVIGMNPGTQEDRQGECWIGPSGQLLSGPYLTGSAITSIATVYLCNVARCVSPGGKPKPAHYRTCFSNTLLDIAAILDPIRPPTPAPSCAPVQIRSPTYPEPGRRRHCPSRKRSASRAIPSRPSCAATSSPPTTQPQSSVNPASSTRSQTTWPCSTPS